MSNQTPYELRFKVLEMARDLCMDHYNVQTTSFWNLHNKIEVMLEQPIGSDYAIVLRDALDELVEATPIIPTPEQINAKARELYEFVSTK